jgi:hypothetical protein
VAGSMPAATWTQYFPGAMRRAPTTFFAFLRGHGPVAPLH